MKRLCAALVFAAVGICGHSSFAADDPRHLMASGIRLYNETNYAKAAEAFDQAASTLLQGKLDPAVPRYDEANTLFRFGRYEDASRKYFEALKTTDLQLQAMSYFNLGKCFFALAKNGIDELKLKEAEQHLDHAAEMYESCLMLKPQDGDAKINLELAISQKQQMRNAVANAVAVLGHAKELVDRYEFSSALDLLVKERPHQQVAFSLEPGLEDQFMKMIGHDTNVLGVLSEPLPAQIDTATNDTPSITAEGVGSK